MEDINELRKLWKLKQLSLGRTSWLNTNNLEKDFLSFSSLCNNRMLTVRPPKFYSLRGEEYDQFADVLKALNVNQVIPPDMVDISGMFDYSLNQDAVVFISPQQIHADHLSMYRSCLNPLIEKVYIEGNQLLKDFALHEALFGKVICKRGDLNVRETHLFPNKFTPGPYVLTTELETPNNTVKDFISLTDLIQDFFAHPKENILSPQKINEAAEKSIALRKNLGSLSRYATPKTQTFSVQTNSYVYIGIENDLFFLYSPENDKNVLVYFGKSQFAKETKVDNLTILMGKERHKTLHDLVELGFFKFSPLILDKRIEELTQLYERATRAADKSLVEEHPTYERLIQELKKIKNYYKEIINPTMVKNYALTLPPELLEFIVYPTTDDPVIHSLLPRVSWNKALRLYHNTPKFIDKFKLADEETMRSMLRSISSNIIFSHQQNNDVNYWLYKNYRQICAQEKIEFKILPQTTN